MSSYVVFELGHASEMLWPLLLVPPQAAWFLSVESWAWLVSRWQSRKALQLSNIWSADLYIYCTHTYYDIDVHINPNAIHESMACRLYGNNLQLLQRKSQWPLTVTFAKHWFLSTNQCEVNDLGRRFNEVFFHKSKARTWWVYGCRCPVWDRFSSNDS